ncbi:WD40-repeat-containing domain protein [Hyaloraphidium curvatum]|nr:WD40-repeat-containing domain protein [Hyaloraphidium curvatum]
MQPSASKRLRSTASSSASVSHSVSVPATLPEINPAAYPARANAPGSSPVSAGGSRGIPLPAFAGAIPSSSSSSNSMLPFAVPHRSPPHTPTRRKSTQYSDRFIPARNGVDIPTNFHALGPDMSSPTRSEKRKQPSGDVDAQKEEANRTYDLVLRSELLGSEISAEDVASTTIRAIPSTPTKSPHKPILQFKSPRKTVTKVVTATDERFSTTPIGSDSQRLLLSPRKTPRHISKTPYKVLDAPDLQDDFYLNLVDWGSGNVLGVGLGHCVYLWNANTSIVTKLCELTSEAVTSVQWMPRGNQIAIGTAKGSVQLWDVAREKKIRQFDNHTGRVGTMASLDNILTSGSRDRKIYHRDIRVSSDYVRKLTGHKQEVCGLKWNTEETQLASGGNDNKLLVWNKMDEHGPVLRFSEHIAAVKAIAWSPIQRGILASGGGTADRRIRFWNTLTGQSLSSIDTGSQVCNLAWSKTSNELVSTHGYSQNQVIVWKYPTMQQIAVLTGHTMRVLYLAMSPDGQNVVTGAGDETLRFWSVFSKGRQKENEDSVLRPFNHIR